jgi:hypothetical protein
METKTSDLIASAKKIFISEPTLSIVGSLPKNFDFEEFKLISLSVKTLNS